MESNEVSCSGFSFHTSYWMVKMHCKYMPDTYLACCYNIYHVNRGNKIEKASFSRLVCNKLNIEYENCWEPMFDQRYRTLSIENLMFSLLKPITNTIENLHHPNIIITFLYYKILTPFYFKGLDFTGPYCPWREPFPPINDSYIKQTNLFKKNKKNS